MTDQPHGTGAASNWVRRWTHLVPPGATVLDVACGAGRHVHWFAEQGFHVLGLDRDAAATAPLVGLAEIVVADIEAGPWPIAGRTFGGVVVTNYLWRERLPDIVASVAEGGVLIYETFASGNETIGKPSNPKFLLRPGELLTAIGGLRVVAFEDGFEDAAQTGARFVQRIVAVRETPGETMPPRHALNPFARMPNAIPGQVKSRDSEDSA